MKTKKISARSITELALAIVFLVFVGYSCGQSAENFSSQDKSKAPESYTEKTEAAPSEQDDETGIKGDTISVSNEEVISSSAAVVSDDTSRKFIRTADIMFRVNNVRSSTLKIEDIISEHKGFVSYTELRSVKQSVKNTIVSEDSVLETVYYIVENNMTLRVPDDELDSTLRAIGRLAVFLDYRIIKADDVSLSLFANELTARRLKKYQQRMSNAIDNKGNRLDDITTAEDSKLRRQEESDNALIEKLSMKDKIDFSTIELKLYQNPSIMKSFIEREKEIEPYKPGFDTRLGNGVMTGWRILEYLVLAIVNLWSILLIVGVTLFIIRFLYKRSKK